KPRPPRRVGQPGEAIMNQTTGGCLCGKVRIIATGAPLRVGICHCLDCRKHHGALFFAAAIFPEAAVTVTGETSDYRGRHFCPTCGSRSEERRVGKECRARWEPSRQQNTQRESS